MDDLDNLRLAGILDELKGLSEILVRGTSGPRLTTRVQPLNLQPSQPLNSLQCGKLTGKAGQYVALCILSVA
jgi:hypothetical protein